RVRPSPPPVPSPPPLKLCYGYCCRLSRRQGKPLPPLRRVESAVELCPVQFHRELPVTRATRDNLIFLQNWFVKFPHYRNRSLFIVGESYAGHYVPQLAELMLEFNKKEKLFNLKGIA
ncbi:hypothetical protein S83_012251, partial [Arachis hypogaea]